MGDCLRFCCRVATSPVVYNQPDLKMCPYCILAAALSIAAARHTTCQLLSAMVEHVGMGKDKTRKFAMNALHASHGVPARSHSITAMPCNGCKDVAAVQHAAHEPLKLLARQSSVSSSVQTPMSLSA